MTIPTCVERSVETGRSVIADSSTEAAPPVIRAGDTTEPPRAEPLQVELPPEERLRQLRVDWPGWSFEHRDDHPIAWTARRQHLKSWRGGHPVCEAETPDILEYLLRQAVQTDATVALLSERARR